MWSKSPLFFFACMTVIFVCTLLARPEPQLKWKWVLVQDDMADRARVCEDLTESIEREAGGRQPWTAVCEMAMDGPSFLSDESLREKCSDHYDLCERTQL